MHIIYVIIFSLLYSAEYYVSPRNTHLNDYDGSMENPFYTIQQAVDTMETGDVCILRKGVYHEQISIDSINDISFESFNDERVVIDGTVSIDSTWVPYSGNIWKTELDFDIWQLFIDRNEIMMARWPNASFEDGSIWDKENHWAHGRIDQDENAYTNGTLIDEPHSDIDLAASGFNIENAIAILNVGSFKTWSRIVNSHAGNTFTYDTVPSWKTKHHDYFLEGKLEFLDSEGEWFFDVDEQELYLWAPNNADPNMLNIRGKVQSYAFQINNSNNVEINGLEFFGTTVKFDNSDYGIIDHCNFYYPSCHKRMLRIVDTKPDMTLFDSSNNCTVKNSAFRYTDGSAIEMYANNNTIENCYFYHIDYSATDLNGLMTTIQMGGSGNQFRYNTMHQMGASATLNPGDAAIIEYNDISSSGYVQSDGAMVQCMVGQQPDVQIRYNWLHDSIKYGARFDGDGDGSDGYIHHNVIWNVEGGIMVKGNNHSIYNNTVFDSVDKNDIIIMIEFGPGNIETITANNAANKIAGHRTGIYNDYPTPGLYQNNWNGYQTESNIKDLLVDPDNYNFSPIDESELIGSGASVLDITEGGDIGAYQLGEPYWVPGITWDVEQKFGLDFVVTEGCMDELACNYNADAIEDDESCEYAEQNFDCNGSCIAETDEGCECGVLYDECGLCDGNGILEDCNSCECASINNIIIPKIFNISNAYPNPFNPMTTINYELPEYSNIQITIYNVLGKSIVELVNENQSAGYYSVNWNADLHPSGIYIMKAIMGDFIATQKLMLIK